MIDNGHFGNPSNKEGSKQGGIIRSKVDGVMKVDGQGAIFEPNFVRSWVKVDGHLTKCGPDLHGRRRPSGQRTKIWAQTDLLMDKFGRWTKIIILRWMSGRIFDDGPSTPWTDSDDGR